MEQRGSNIYGMLRSMEGEAASMHMHVAGLSHSICNDAEVQHLFPPLFP